MFKIINNDNDRFSYFHSKEIAELEVYPTLTDITYIIALIREIQLKLIIGNHGYLFV